VLAVAHRIAVLLYCVERDGTTYEDREDHRAGGSASRAARAAAH
jgi:hypothetical protein